GSVQGREKDAAGRVYCTRANLDVRDRLGDDLVVDRVERGNRAVIKVAAVGALLTCLFVDAALEREERDGRAILREAALDADAVGDILDRVVCGGLVCDAAVPGRAGLLLAIATQ